MTQFSQTRLHGSARRPSFSFNRMIEINRQRRALALLDDRALLDIGLTRQQVDAELRRPFWDVA
ncbi:MAG: DUF1127 domain-containing protein [Pseudomonadota bacterium]